MSPHTPGVRCRADTPRVRNTCPSYTRSTGSHQKHLEWTPQRLLNWGERIGPATCSIIRRLLEDKPHAEMGYRSCLGVFSLARRYGEERLEAACARALTIGSPKRKTVQSILEAGLDRHADLFPAAATPLPTHGNVRGPDYYH